MKKCLGIVLVAVLVLSLFACGKPKINDSDITTYKIGICIYNFSDNFMTLYRQEMEAYFKTLETDTVRFEVTVVDSELDMTLQISQVDAFIAQGVDVLIINLVQASKAASITEKADAAGVPVVYINREPSEDDMNASDNICYVGADARQSGTFQGEIIRDLADNGDADGDGVVRYVMIMGDPDSTSSQTRVELPIKALTDAGIEVEMLFQQNGQWSFLGGQELAAHALAQFGDKIDVIFCNNDYMALGAYQSIVAAGRVVGEDIYLVGVDALDECVEMVHNGTMTGTIRNDYVAQAHAAADAAINYINGMSNSKYIWVDYQKIV